MLRLGEFRGQNCAGPTRREFLQVGGCAGLALSLPDWFRWASAGAAEGNRDISCILLFLWGGMPQQDTFDLKPKAPDTIRGQFFPVPTAVPGIQVCELLPQLAAGMKRYTIVRSSTHRETEHPRAAHFMMTGNQVIRGQEWPNMGATVTKYGAQKTPLGSVVIGPRLIDQPITPTGQDGGFLGNIYAPFRIADPTLPVDKLAVFNPPAGLTAERMARRDKIFRSVQEFERDLETDETAALDAAYNRALGIVTNAQVKQAFDLSREKPEVREQYGNYAFGQGALMARRLVEAGVKFVQVNWREHPINDYGFDNHGDNFNKLKNIQLPQIDRTVPALLADLEQRGMLENTLVLMTGEFGRTPTINGSAGRDHWPFCFSYLIAGGGVPGGRVLGASDQFAAYPADNPVSPENTVASVFERLGLNLRQLRDAKVIDDIEEVPGLLG